MFPFSKRYELSSTDFFEGFVDVHCHILWGVDDGVRSLTDSLEVLHYYEELGVKEVVMTPHVMEGMKVTRDEREVRYVKLCDAYTGNLQLRMAGEYMLDEGLAAEIEGGLRPIKKNSVLVETSCIAAPCDLEQKIFAMELAGYSPIIAHPERYLYMTEKDYDLLRNKRYALQLNLPSLVGVYGDEVRRRALKLLMEGRYSYVGTDLHRLEVFKYCVKQLRLKKRELDALFLLKEKGRD